MLDELCSALELDPTACHVQPVSGGNVHLAFRLEVSGRDPLFVKTVKDPAEANGAKAGMFAAEVAGLDALRRAISDARIPLAVPAVVYVDPRYLALQWIGEGTSGWGVAAAAVGTGSSDPARTLGEGLALLHRYQAAYYGWPEDNWIGTLPQYNTAVPFEQGAAEFFVARRLRPQIELCADKLPTDLLNRLDRFCEQAAQWLDVEGEQPTLLHGDLWSGNWTTDALGNPWIYDPAIHYGCRETEIAFTHLFTRFPAAFYDAYEQNFPLAPGFSERIDLWNLYSLLVHLNLFGMHYASYIEEVLRHRVG